MTTQLQAQVVVRRKQVQFLGMKLVVTPEMDQHTAKILLGKVDAGHTEYQAILDFVGPSDVVVDIGAGSMACALLVAKQGARVIAYEPSPALIGVASENLENNPNLQVEAYFGWGVCPAYRGKRDKLRLPGSSFDEASFESACLPPHDGAPVPINMIESIETILHRERPNIIFVETSGMACALVKAVGAMATNLRPMTIIARLRTVWEGRDHVNQTISTMGLFGFRITRSYLGCDGLVFQRPGKEEENPH